MSCIRRSHPAIALLGLLAYVVAAFGFLPSPDFVRDALGIHGADRFPCESHSCGCHDAESCLSNCCCYTPSETRAWAKANNLDPVAWARLDAALPDESVEMGDDCPLCALEEDADDPKGLELPTVSALGCKRVGQWLLIPAPIAPKPMRANTAGLHTPRDPSARPASQRVPSCAPLDTPEPPPRRA